MRNLDNRCNFNAVAEDNVVLLVSNSFNLAGEFSTALHYKINWR